jgi:hypothetical protein
LSTAGSAWPRFNSVCCVHGVAPLVWEPKLAPEWAQDTYRSAKGRIPAAAFTEQWRGLRGGRGPAIHHAWDAARIASALPSAGGTACRLADTLKFGRRMLSSFRAFRVFPTVFWLTGCSDASLRAAMDAGCVVYASNVYYGGGSFTPAILLAAWILFLSVATVFPEVGCPWDYLLLKVGLATAVSILRLLLERVMVGVGKLKFAAGWTQHSVLEAVYS